MITNDCCQRRNIKYQLQYNQLFPGMTNGCSITNSKKNKSIVLKRITCNGMNKAVCACRDAVFLGGPFRIAAKQRNTHWLHIAIENHHL